MENIISEVRLWPPRNPSAKLLSSGFMIMGGKVKVRCAVIKSTKGDVPFVVLPYHEDGDGNKFNDVEGVNAEATKELKAYILSKHNEILAENNTFDQTKDEKTEEVKDEKPWG